MEEFNLKRHDVIGILVSLFVVSSLLIIYLCGKYLLPILDAFIFSLPLLYIQDQVVKFATENVTVKRRCKAFFMNTTIMISYVFLSVIAYKELTWIGLVSLNLTMFPLYLLSTGKWISNSRSAFVVLLIFISSILLLLFYQAGTEIRNIAKDFISLKEEEGFKKYESILNFSYNYFESVLQKKTGKTLVNFANETATKLQIPTKNIAFKDPFSKVSYILSLFLKFKESDSFKNAINIAKKSINSDIAIKVISIAINVICFTFAQFNSTFEMMVMIITFASTLFHLTRGKKITEVQLFNKIFEDYQPLVQKIKESITMILANLIHQTWLELIGSYVVFSLGGSKLPAIWSILASILTIFPFFNILIVCALVIFELAIREMYYNALGVIVFYMMYQIFMVPKSIVPFSTGYSNYLIGISIAAGYYTFGIHGVLLGPLITSIPGILFDLIKTYSDLISSPILSAKNLKVEEADTSPVKEKK